MSRCRPTRWFMVVSSDGKNCLVYNHDTGSMNYVPLLGCVSPYRFATIDTASRFATNFGGRVRIWRGKD